MWRRFRHTLTASIDLLLPPACLLCGKQLLSDRTPHALCQHCQAGMSPLEPGHCTCCAQPFPTNHSNHLCGLCLKRPPSFSRVHAASSYHGSIKEAIHAFKYRNQLTLAKPLGHLLGKTFSAQRDDFIPDQIVPVPLHRSRLSQRGYNQALELARSLSRQVNIPLAPSLLQRVRKTPQQQGLSAKERRRNLHNAFTLTRQPTGLNLLLVDDVMTTGETVRECSRVLLAGGATEVQIAVIGRA